MDIDQYLQTENWFDYHSFYDFISEKNYKKLVEVGVWKGHSVSYLAAKNRDSKIYAVDLFELSRELFHGEIQKQIPYIYDIYNKNLELTGTRKTIRDIKGLSWDVANHFQDQTVDFVFLDASHNYESVTKDINAWFPKVRSGGIIAGHDYSWDGVNSAVKEFAGEELEILTYEGSVWYINKI